MLKKRPGNKGLLMMMNCFCGMVDQQKDTKSFFHLDHPYYSILLAHGKFAEHKIVELSCPVMITYSLM